VVLWTILLMLRRHLTNVSSSLVWMTTVIANLISTWGSSSNKDPNLAQLRFLISQALPKQLCKQHCNLLVQQSICQVTKSNEWDLQGLSMQRKTLNQLTVVSSSSRTYRTCRTKAWTLQDQKHLHKLPCARLGPNSSTKRLIRLWRPHSHSQLTWAMSRTANLKGTNLQSLS